MSDISRVLSNSGFSPPYFCFLIRASVAAPAGVFHLLHRFVDGFLHAKRVSALAEREVLKALKMRDDERARGGRRPKFCCHELATLVLPLLRDGRHLLHRVHQQIGEVWDAGVGFLDPPETMVLD